MKVTYSSVLLHHWKGCEWVMHNDDINTLIWHSTNNPEPTIEELEEAKALYLASEPLRLLRAERTRRLAETDWVAIRAFAKNETIPEDWAMYMQALRDLPSVSNPILNDDGSLDMASVTWPTPPS
jgi:hypothetical protein